MSFLYFCPIFLMFIQIEGSRSNKETSISPLCHSPSLLPSHTEIKWMRVDSVFFFCMLTEAFTWKFVQKLACLCIRNCIQIMLFLRYYSTSVEQWQ